MLTYKKLVPDSNMLKMERLTYTEKFTQILAKLDPQKVISEIIELSKGKDAALLCYEKLQNPNEWCHRTMVAKWLEKNTKVKISEF